jgi:hypothetical protein
MGHKLIYLKQLAHGRSLSDAAHRSTNDWPEILPPSFGEILPVFRFRQEALIRRDGCFSSISSADLVAVDRVLT